MAQSTISIRVDQGLKQKFDSLCEAFGLSATAAFNIFMKAVVREKKIPFEIKADSSELIKGNAMAAFEALRKSAAENNLVDMNLADINAEIKASRDERKEKNICGVTGSNGGNLK